MCYSQFLKMGLTVVSHILSVVDGKIGTRRGTHVSFIVGTKVTEIMYLI